MPALYVKDSNSFVPAYNLSPGQQLIKLSGEAVPILRLRTITLDEPVAVYNLRVQGNHNYFVTRQCILTHNCDGLMKGTQESVQQTLAGIKEAILHPLDTAAALGNAVIHADKIAAQLANKVVEVLLEFPEYSATEKGELIGKLTAELATAFAPGAAIKAGSHLAKIASNSKFGSKVISAMNQAATDAGLTHREIINGWKAHPERGSVGSPMLGRNGVQTTSKTIWKGKGKERIDVKNPNPGKRPGQIHYQDNQNNKYIYDPKTKSFKNAPKTINDKLKEPEFNKAIEKGMKQYLGET